MSYWTIRSMDCGYTDGPTPNGKDWAIPFMNYYLTDGHLQVLVDNGVRDGYIQGGKSGWGYTTVGGEEYVTKGLSGVGVRPSDIDLVIYTHFHWDHVGNCHLFPQATHIFQDAEWKEMVDPLPCMDDYLVYDKPVIDELRKLPLQRVHGDVELLDGIELLHSPGHSAGSQCVRVNTQKGHYIITGDLINTYWMAYPEWTEWVLLNGTVTTIDPDVARWMRTLFLVTVYDNYAWHRSQYRIKALARERQFLIPSHDASVLGKTFG